MKFSKSLSPETWQMVEVLRLYVSELTVFVLFLWARVEYTILCLVLIHNSSIILFMVPIVLLLSSQLLVLLVQIQRYTHDPSWELQPAFVTHFKCVNLFFKQVWII